jgi:hypothetical protein
VEGRLVGNVRNFRSLANPDRKRQRRERVRLTVLRVVSVQLSFGQQYWNCRLPVARAQTEAKAADQREGREALGAEVTLAVFLPARLADEDFNARETREQIDSTAVSA